MALQPDVWVMSVHLYTHCPYVFVVHVDPLHVSRAEQATVQFFEFASNMQVGFCVHVLPVTDVTEEHLV